MAGSDFVGMTTNERLYIAGLLGEFEKAAGRGDRLGMVALLTRVDLGPQANDIAHAVLARPSDPGILRTTGSVRKYNKQGREIWFARFGWSYMPSHWKGIVFPLLIILPTVVLSLLLDSVNDWASAIPLLVGVLATLWLCERHSPSRENVR